MHCRRGCRRRDGLLWVLTLYIAKYSMLGKHAKIGNSAAWVEHFERSLLRPEIMRGSTPIRLSPEERAAIATSVAEFQLGEISEGRHLIAAACRYAQRTGDVDYVAALRLFIAEENRHARELGRFLDRAGLGRVSSAWSDTVFRCLRRGAGLELSIVVLVAAKIIAKVYYAALRRATCSPELHQLCTRILQDERHHVMFQTQRLALLRTQRSRLSIITRVALHRFLMAGTCLVVWRKHGRAMRAGGMGLKQLWRATWREMRSAIPQMDPRSYPALTPESAQSASAGSAPLTRAVRVSPASRLRDPQRADRRAGTATLARIPDPLQLTSEDVT